MEAILIYGCSGSGKTTMALRCYKMALSLGWSAGGIICPGVFQDNVRYSFDLVDLWTGKQVKLATRGDNNSSIQVGKFNFDEEGVKIGNLIIENAISRPVNLLIIDEIGPLELSGKGWASSLQKAVKKRIPNILLTVRPSILQEVSKHFLNDYSCISFGVEEEGRIFSHWKNL